MSDAGWGKLLRLHFLKFFLSKPHFENSSLVCHVTVDHQIPVTACHLFLFILASKEHERSSADIKKKKLTCGLGWWRRAETSVGHEAVKVKIQSELSHRMIAVHFFNHVVLYTERSFTAKLISMQLKTMAHKVKGVVCLVTMNSTLTIPWI